MGFFRYAAVLSLALLIGCDFFRGVAIGTSDEAVRTRVCRECGGPTELDFGCPVRIMAAYPHEDYNRIKSDLDRDAAAFASREVDVDVLVERWGLPQSERVIDRQQPIEGYDMLSARDKERFANHIQYYIYTDIYNFSIDRNHRVFRYDLAEGVGDYQCSRCGGAYRLR